MFKGEVEMKADIEKRINDNFSDIDLVKQILSELSVPNEELERVIRCVLYLSENDYDSLKHFVSVANIDRRDVYYWAEYDKLSRRRWDFSKEFNEQSENKYES